MTGPSQNSIFNCHNPKALKFITQLGLGLSHLRYHKFKHNFQDSLNPLCNCGLITETTSHYLLHCPLFADERKTFLSNMKSINHKFLEQNDSTLTQTFLFGGPASSIETNTLISRQQFNMFYLLNDLRKLSCTQNHVNHFQRF